MQALELSPFATLILEYLQIMLGTGSRMWPGYLLAFVFIAFAVYKMEGLKSGFWKYLFPKEFYFSDSVKTDVKLFLFNSFVKLFDVFNSIAGRAFIAVTIISWLGGNTSGPSSMHPLIVALILFVAADFWIYLYHRLHHTFEPLWVFHAVHHSSEFLVPISRYRSHPIYGLFSRTFRTLFLGVVDGILLALFVTSIDFATLIGINTLAFIYSITGNNLRHSHIWLSYGPYLSYIFISPAMHQIHHSRDPRHWNKNYGGAFAIFDWMFGTLYIPKEKEELEFGIVDKNGNPIQPHDGFVNAVFVPFKHLGQWWVRRKSKNPNELQRARYN